MAQEYVITGVSLGTRERRQLHIRAADERAAGWAAIERGVEVLSIEPAAGRGRPTPMPSRDEGSVATSYEFLCRLWKKPLEHLRGDD